MTLEQFLRKFKKLAPEGSWQNQGGKHIRSAYPNHCPLTFVASKETGGRHLPAYYHHSAIDLGMTEGDADLVAAAADRGRMKSSRVRAVRKRLLKACGLKD